jgi:NADH:ubiquinone oxidoreductase subunit 5 (subunit L)/multisubunit Na+/H+ antiporter MnhA subunit
MAKSAQILLHPWLTDAMAGPTPVSALLHAATMVTAGVFLLFRIFNNEQLLLPPFFSFLTSFIGLLTLFFGGLSSFFQYDIKKVIALSTSSQIGLMFLSLSDSSSSSLFHLFSHGFFKALLFLSAGYFIHFFSSSFPLPLGLEQDLRKLGSLLFSSPFYFLCFFIGSLSLIAFPSFSGFFSKDSLLFSSSSWLFLLILLGSFFSCFYSFKLLSSSFSLLPLPTSNPHWFSSSFLSSLPLLFGSLFIGSLFSSFLSPFSSSLFSFEFFNSFFPVLSSFFSSFFSPSFFLFIPLFSFLLFFLFSFPPFFSLRSLFNLRFSFDSLFNLFLFFPSFSFSYHFSFKFIDRGLLELFGPVGLFRLFVSSPLSSSPRIWLSPYFLLYWFFFFLLFFFSFFFLS